MKEENIIEIANVMMTTIKIATKLEDSMEAVAIVPKITDAEEDMIPQNPMKREAGMDPAKRNKNYQSLQQLMIANKDLKAVGVDSSSLSTKKNGGETKWHDNLNMVQKMYILAA